MSFPFGKLIFVCSICAGAVLRLAAKQTDVMVSLPQHMVCKKGQNDGTNLTLLDSLCACRFKLPELHGFFQCIGGQCLIVCAAAAFKQSGILLGECIRRLDQLRFCGIQQPADEKSVFHHDLIPKALGFLHMLLGKHTIPFQCFDELPVQLGFADDMLDQKGIIHREQFTVQDFSKNRFFEMDQAVKQANGGSVHLLYLPGQMRGSAGADTASAEPKLLTGDLPVDGNAGEALGLLFRQCGEFGNDLTGAEDGLARHTAA